MPNSSEPLRIEEIVQELSQPLLHYLKRHVGDHAVAEDLRQETLIRMARSFASFAGRSSVKTWAFSIATRVASDYFRAPERRFQMVEMEEAGELSDRDLAFDDRMVESEMNACIRQVIDSLPDPYRAALILHDLEELSVEQTAEVCECSVATAKIRIHRAKVRLKEALKAQCSFYRDNEGTYRCDRK